MTDIDILNYVFSESGKLMHTRLIDMPQDMIDYLCNRYTDSESLKESIYRLKYNIEIRPVCPVCGGLVKFYGKTNAIFGKTCSLSCSAKLTAINTKESRIRKYGSYNNSIKGVHTRKLSGMPYKNEQKCKDTCLERYGNSTYRNPNKSISTCLERYGTKYYLCSDDCKEKTIAALGTDNYRKTEASKKKVSEYNITHKTELNNKRTKTCLERYGVENYAQSEEYKKIVGSEEFQQRRREHEYITKKKNNSFNSSKTEAESFVRIKAKYPDVVAQYKSDSYPFNCDFYIPSLDLYIECNYHWTHGGKPYNEDSCKEQLELWKNKHSKFYDNAIQTWTIRDVIKRQTAQERNLHFIEFWNIKELKEWLNINN